MSSTPLATDSTSPPSAGGDGGLRGTVTTWPLFFMVLAYTAPLAATIGLLPVIIGYGNGVGAPSAIIAVGVLIALFAVGFVTMSRNMDRPGGFYGFITAGLGRVAGLGAAYVATVSYYLLLIANYAFGGISLQPFVRDTLHGPDIEWWVWMIVLQAIVAVLGFFRLDLSAKILSVVLIGEIIIVLVYNAFVIGKGGADGFSAASFGTDAMFSGSVGVALLLAITCFGGFEATVIFRDEVKDPSRTIPRATYMVVGFVTVVYSLTAWTFIQSYGDDAVVGAAGADPSGSFIASIQSYVGDSAVDISLVLLNTSIFACALSAHNIVGRYLFNLGTDRTLPSFLGSVHKRHGSPHLASTTISILAFLGLGALAIAGTDPATLYASLIGIYGYSLIILMAVTGAAVLFYLRGRRTAGNTPWNSVIAPGLALVGLAGAVVLATVNLDALVNGSETVATWTIVGIVATGVIGCLTAMYFRAKRPDTFSHIGRQ